MKYLFTGAGGFLGSIITKSVYAKGNTVVRLGRSENDDVVQDLRRPFSLESIAGQPGIDIVIHIAGKAHSVPKNEDEINEFYNVNLEGTINLCSALSKLDKLPTSFIFISTVSVYGLEEGMSIDENFPLKGNTPYALSKIKAEQFLQRWAKQNAIILSILRLPLVAGPNPPGNLGVMINGIKSGRYLSIGRAEARKSTVWAEDIAAIIPKLATKGGIYNLTDGCHPRFKDFEQIISSAFKKSKPVSIPLPVAKILGKVGDFFGTRIPINTDKIHKITSSLTFSDEKARKELNWKPSSVIKKLSETL